MNLLSMKFRNYELAGIWTKKDSKNVKEPNATAALVVDMAEIFVKT